ncbi:MAG TPA: alpha/beta hydrolase, partial [Herpetosiphonaceae bacterium]
MAAPLACAESAASGEAAAGRPVLVLLHPGGMRGGAWAPFGRCWGADFRILVPDLEPGRSASVRSYADAVGELLERRAAGPAHVVGASLGANVALQLAAAAPGLVASLVLDSAQAGGPPSRALAGLAG